MSGEVVGHEAVFERFRRALRRGRLASTFLFVGPAGVGKRLVARRIAQSLLCEVNAAERLEPCGDCPACRMFLAGNHPDFLVVSKPPDRSTIPLEAFIGDRDNRMKAGLCYDISLKPFRGGRRIALIDDADHLSGEGANCLLKTLEEPPPRSLLILLGTSEQRQLPTIRSRCQVVRFQPLPRPDLERLLVQQGLADTAEQARELAELAEGSLQRAGELADADLREYRVKLLGELPVGPGCVVAAAKELAKFVEAAGTQAAVRRTRMRLLLGFAADFYRQVMRGLAGVAVVGDPPLQRAAAAALKSWRGTVEMAADCLDTCLTMEQYVEANANLNTLAECWLDELLDKSTVRRPAAS